MSTKDAHFVCRGCSSLKVRPVVDLGEIPASDYFPPIEDDSMDPRWVLCLYLCKDCLLVQLGPSDHPEPEAPRAVESATSRRHAAESAAGVMRVEGLCPGNSVIEIDSHHGGSWLGGFAAAGLVGRGPDSTADLVVDVHGLAHEPLLESPLAAHAARLGPGGRLVLEFHHLQALVEQSQIDTIRHGHWVYLSLLSMSNLFGRHGLVATRAIRMPVFGGSLRVTANRTIDDPVVDASVAHVLAEERRAGLDRVETYLEFGRRGRAVAANFRRHLIEARTAGRTVAGYGAPSKAPVLLALAEVDKTLLPYTVDLSPAKHARRLPGTAIGIRAPQELLRDRPDEVVILTWDIAREVVDQLRQAAHGSKWAPSFYVPLPEAGYLDTSAGGEPRADLLDD